MTAKSLAYLFSTLCLAGCTAGKGIPDARLQREAFSDAGSASGSQPQDGASSTCRWPSGADTYSDASGDGCRPRPALEVCGVPSGSTVYADGAVSTPDGAPAQCADSCTDSEYALSCRGTAAAASLGCRVIPLPTPQDVTEYCCPCAP